MRGSAKEYSMTLVLSSNNLLITFFEHFRVLNFPLFVIRRSSRLRNFFLSLRGGKF